MHAIRRRALAVASAGYFFVLLDVTIVNVALARIGGDLGASRNALQWVVDAYALVLGPVLGGLLVDPLGWRAIFWLNVPLVIAALALALLYVPRSSGARGEQPDVAGQLLGTATLLAAVFALIEGGREGFLSTPCLVGAPALVLLASFLAVELRVRRRCSTSAGSPCPSSPAPTPAPG
jgi:MFS family permease